MARPLRYFEPWQPVEITARTVQGRHLLKPSPLLNALIVGVIAIAKERYPIRIFNLVFLSNHFHIIAAAESPKDLSDFMRFVMGNIAREAGRMHNWSGPFWARRHRVIPIVDDQALIARMKYVFENGCKEGLVRHPALWEGLNAARALTEGIPLIGKWINRTALYLRRRTKKAAVGEADFTTHHELHLDPLPCWEHLPVGEQRANYEELIRDVARAYQSMRGVTPRQRPADPHYRPERLSSKPAPLCHASTKRARKAFRAAYRAFVECYRAATGRLECSLGSLGFPDQSQVLAFAVR